MDVRLILPVCLYLLIGVFLITVFNTVTHTSVDSFCILLVVSWPMVAVILLCFGIINLTYKAGVWAGEYIRDKFDC